MNRSGKCHVSCACTDYCVPCGRCARSDTGGITLAVARCVPSEPWHGVGGLSCPAGVFTEAEARELAQSLTGNDPGPVEWALDDLPDDPAEAVCFLELTRYMRN